MSTSPYENLPKSSFWSSGVAQSSPFELRDIYKKKWEISPQFKIATAGSCFAQHISRHLSANGYRVLNLEPAPPRLPAELHNKFGFSMYSCRYGNIYTTQQLLQLALEVAGQFEPRNLVWEKGGRFYDSLRPACEPEGLGSPEEVSAHRKHHLSKVKEMFQTMDLFIFTLGLTEGWIHRESGTVYPTAPGTLAGEFDSEIYAFKNYHFAEVMQSFHRFQEVVRDIRGGKSFQILLTVSPVPLTATASGKHVLQATNYSKAILRSVAGQLSEEQDNIDYFPSYEIITNQSARGTFYENNLRSVRTEGVELVMKQFFSEHKSETDAGEAERHSAKPVENDQALINADVQCEDQMLETFRK